MKAITHQVEREFLWALLNLGLVDDLPALLDDALGLFLRVAGAQRGFISLNARHGQHTWCRSRALEEEEVEQVRRVLSSGIMREAIASGETIHTASAITDPRFQKRESVQRHNIEAAICAPIVVDELVGVVYLQGRIEQGPFKSEDIQRIELFARHLAPYADRLLRRDESSFDPTRKWRHRLVCPGLIGSSPALADMLREVALIAPLDLPVLLLGDTGCGKTAVARVIHDSGPRAGEPFVELNCAAIPHELVESELFGAERGAHSAALQRVIGKVAAASGGTLFLDEVGELPLTSQAKFLQFLQSGEYWSLGSSSPQKSSARIIAATNADLKTLVDQKKFRADLFYRLNVFTVRIPSLAERHSDRIPIAEYFLKKACARHHLPELELSPSGRVAILRADYPGNIRELANSVERAAVVAAGDRATAVAKRHLFPSRRHSVSAPPAVTYTEQLRAFQRDLLEVTLIETDGNVSEAARRLQIARSHFYNLMNIVGIVPGE